MKGATEIIRWELGLLTMWTPCTRRTAATIEDIDVESMLAGLDMKHGVIPVARDDVNDMSVLNPDMVIEARKTEVESFRTMHVYDVVPRYMIW